MASTDFLLSVVGLDPEEFLVNRFTGSEGISELFKFDVELVSLNSQVEFESVIGKDVKLTVLTADGERQINGIAVRFEQLGTGRRFTSYRLRMMPRLWTLGLRHQSRIFQNMTIPDIVEQVFETAGYPAANFSMEVSGTHASHVYRVQYQETDLQFVSRLLEEEGIYFWFGHDSGTEKMVLADKMSIHNSIVGDPLVPCKAAESAVGREEVSEFRCAQQIETGAVMLRDFEFKKPTAEMTAKVTAEVAAETEYEYYEYPGEYSVAKTGADLAAIRLEEIRTRRKIAMGKSSCRRFDPGYLFELAVHKREDFNIEHLLIRVEHWGIQPQFGSMDSSETETEPVEEVIYYNHFTCIPATVQFRPPRRTERPRVDGPQTAVVTGPAGEEVWPDPDGYGCVKVQFHWDRQGSRDEKSSCWVRVGQSWAGAGWGALFTPRIGMEVIVEFIEGNPDRPVITGCVYNGANPLPCKLPDDKTVSTLKSNSSLGGGGDNEFRFEDKAGEEEVFLHAQKDWNTDVGNNKAESVGNDQEESVGHDKNETVGNDETISIGANRKESVGGSEKLSVGKSRSRIVATTETISVGAARTHSVGANESINVGAAQEIAIGAKQVLAIGASQAVSVGANQTVSVGKDQTLSVGKDQTEDVAKKRTVTIGEDDALQVEKNMVIDVGESLTIKVGKVMIHLKKDGTVQIQAADIKIKASGKVDLKASKNVILKGSKIMQN